MNPNTERSSGRDGRLVAVHPTAKANAEPGREPVVLTVVEACQVLRISRWMLYRLIHSRRLETIKIGRRRFVPAAAVQEFIDRLRAEEGL